MFNNIHKKWVNLAHERMCVKHSVLFIGDTFHLLPIKTHRLCSMSQTLFTTIVTQSPQGSEIVVRPNVINRADRIDNQFQNIPPFLRFDFSELSKHSNKKYRFFPGQC